MCSNMNHPLVINPKYLAWVRLDYDDDEGTDDWRSAREGRRMLGSAGFTDQNLLFLAVCAED